MSPKIYLSAALFTLAEQRYNQDLARRLAERGFEVFLPQEIDHQGDDQRAVFELNLAGIRGADVVVSLVEGADVDAGVAWEMGYAYALGKPVISVRTDFRNRSEHLASPLNLMLYYGSREYVEDAADPFSGLVACLSRL